MDYVYFICIGLFGLVMTLSPSTFMGRAKYDEDSIKTQSLLKKVGIGIMIFCVLMMIYFYIK